MSVARLDKTATPAHPQIAHNARTLRLLEGSIVPTLLRMAWPNVLVMVAQAATGLIETYFVAKLGTDALAGMALVFPCVMLMQMISAGAMGGGISSLSKVCILAPSEREDADIDYTFAQVQIREPRVDYRANCGNMSSAVGPFSLDEGLVRADGDMATVRIYNTNTHKLIHATFPLAEAASAHRLMESSTHIGKIMLRVAD